MVAFVFFGLGIIVGIAAFKVLPDSVHRGEIDLYGIYRGALRSNGRQLKSSCPVRAPRTLVHS